MRLLPFCLTRSPEPFVRTSFFGFSLACSKRDLSDSWALIGCFLLSRSPSLRFTRSTTTKAKRVEIHTLADDITSHSICVSLQNPRVKQITFSKCCSKGFSTRRALHHKTRNTFRFYFKFPSTCYKGECDSMGFATTWVAFSLLSRRRTKRQWIAKLRSFLLREIKVHFLHYGIHSLVQEGLTRKSKSDLQRVSNMRFTTLNRETQVWENRPERFT